MSTTSSEHLCRRFSVEEIVSATDNFDDALIIGKGGFGTVYKGILDHGSSIVAVKRLNPSSKQGAPEFWAEINMLSRFRHSHLVSLIGYCNDGNEMVLVYEFMIHGTLADHLYKNRKNNINSVNLSWVQRLRICIGAARGLDYLHTGTAILERVIHRDVKSSNILLDQNWAARISDFGLSRIGPANQESTDVSTKHIQGTFGYMDPDYFLTQRFTRKSDVYAFGVVLLEVLSERPAVDRSLLDKDQWGLAGWGLQCINDGVPHHLICANLKWEILQTSLMEFVEIASQCLHNRPAKRPTMSEVVAKLELALSLQLRTDVLLDDDYLNSLWPFGSRENTDSYTKDNRSDHVDNSVSKHLETPVLSENSDVKPSSSDSKGHNSKTVDKVENFIQNVAITNDKIVTPNLKKFEFSELKTATKNFRYVLGEGECGRVYKGWVDEKTYLPSKVGGKVVAVKRLKLDGIQGPAEGLMEVEMMGKLSHPNLVELLGYYYDEDRRMLNTFDKIENTHEFILVYEYMHNQSLNNHLYRRNRSNSLSWSTRIKIALGTARALCFLHASDNQIILRDFKTSSILLDENFDAKLSGLGLAKNFDAYIEDGYTHTTTRVMGTYGYAAPEYLATGHLRPESDIYSFGVVLLEVLTGMKAMDNNRAAHMSNLVVWAKPILPRKRSIAKIVDPNMENDYSLKQAFRLALLIKKCLENNPKMRPSMKQVLQDLESISSRKPKNVEASTRPEIMEASTKPEIIEASTKPEIVEAWADTYKLLCCWTCNLRKTSS